MNEETTREFEKSDNDLVPESLKQKIQIDETFSKAFDQSKGFKSVAWLAVLISVLVYIVIAVIQLTFLYLGTGSIDAAPEPTGESIIYDFVGQALFTFLGAPLTAGFAILALKRLRGEALTSTEVLKHYGKIIPLFVSTLLVYVMLILGFVLFIIPGVYLAVAYIFTSYLIVDKGLSPWQAMETSRKAVAQQWFTVFACVIGVSVFNLVAMLPLGIGLIWSLPWSMLVYASLYQKLFDEV